MKFFPKLIKEDLKMPAILVLVLIFIILLILVSCIRIVPQAQAMDATGQPWPPRCAGA